MMGSAVEHLQAARRSLVGPADKYDLVGAMQFKVLTDLGLREYHSMLDLGCGSLRGGRFFIPYLLPSRYYGIEPNVNLLCNGVKEEIGQSLINIKTPVFDHNDQYDMKVFGKKFDYILAQSIFSHAPEKDILKCLSQLKDVLYDNGIMVATFFVDQEDYKGTNWTGIAKYTNTTINRMVQDNGLQSIKLEYAHPNKQTWYMIIRGDRT